MEQVNIHAAKTHLSALVDRVAGGEAIIIAKNGVPMAKLVPFTAPSPRRTGFMKGRISVPEEFDSMFHDEIDRLFYGDGGRTGGDDGESR